MLHYFGSKISPNMADTPEGYLLCRNVPIARTGTQTYLARELGLENGDPDRPVTVYRGETEVFDPAAMASFEGKDITDEHPPETVTPANFASYTKGHLQNVRREGELLVADLFVKDPTLISEIKNRIKREVSCGYFCEYEPEGNGYRQTHIRGNHVAVVPRGRAGHEIAIKDSDPESQKGAHKMSATKALLEFFGLAAKDASPEELKELTENTAKVLDAEPAAKAQEAEPTKPSKDEDIPEGDDLGSKLDKILERIETIEKKFNGHGGPEKSSDETTIDEELTKLEGDACGKDEEVIEEEKEEVRDPELVTKLLRMMRPIVASIKDKDTKSAVTDALLDSVRGQSAIPGIQKASVASAKQAADAAAKTNYEKICEGQQDVYNARNPHTKKKEG